MEEEKNTKRDTEEEENTTREMEEEEIHSERNKGDKTKATISCVTLGTGYNKDDAPHCRLCWFQTVVIISLDFQLELALHDHQDFQKTLTINSEAKKLTDCH
ncbi:hypothetical protein ElyMa_004708700 [Elysia marginata]|uniref:Uncharacterized protein n=1 Tax=Elysia marginata TaxID=1093978 RepID=A0AAV4IAC9_9GAST|nr:hypothetical protein ElyMa_004708700 [Elysia marginata]